MEKCRQKDLFGVNNDHKTTTMADKNKTHPPVARGTIRSRISRAKKKAEEDRKQIEANPLHAFDKALETAADRKARETYSLESGPKRTVHRRRATFRQQFSQQAMADTPYTVHPQTGEVLTVCNLLLEHFNQMTPEQQAQIVQNWTAAKDREREDYIHGHAMHGMAVQHTSWLLYRYNQTPTATLSALQQMLPPPPPAPGTGNGRPPLPIAGNNPGEIGAGADNGNTPNNNIGNNHYGNNGAGNVPTGRVSPYEQDPAGASGRSSPNENILPAAKKDDNGGAKMVTRVMFDSGVEIAVDLSTLSQETIDELLFKTARELDLVPDDLSHCETLVGLILDMDEDTEAYTIIFNARKASKKCLKNRTLGPLSDLAKENNLVCKVLEELSGGQKKQGPNAADLEELRKRTGTTPFRPLRPQPFAAKTSGINQIATPEVGGTSNEDALEVNSDDDVEDEISKPAAVAEPVFKCCAGDECTMFKFGLERNVLLSTHNCLDCLGRVHAPGQSDMLVNPCCIPLADNKPLLRRVKVRLGKEKANSVGCICRHCFLEHYQAMPSPPPSPIILPTESVYECAVCLDTKGKADFDSLVALKDHPQFAFIVQAAIDKGEPVDEQDYGCKLCRDCGVVLLGSEYQGVQLTVPSDAHTSTELEQTSQELARDAPPTKKAGQHSSTPTDARDTEPVTLPTTKAGQDSSVPRRVRVRRQGCLRRPMSTRSMKRTTDKKLP